MFDGKNSRLIEGGIIMRVLRLAAAVSAALLTCACLPVTTKTPIGSTAGFKPDPALYGVWRDQNREKDNEGFISFLKDGQDGMTAVLVSPSSDGGDWQVFQVKTATLGGRTFMNAREIQAHGKAADDELAGHDIPVLYRVRGRTLTLILLDEKKTAAAIRAGAITGTIDPGEYGDVHITADAAALDKFIESDAGIALFSARAIVMKRVD
jgi:hypothetical protein